MNDFPATIFRQCNVLAVLGRDGRFLLVGVCLSVTAWALAGCGKSQPAVDPAPMKVAIEQYLQQNNMRVADQGHRAGARRLRHDGHHERVADPRRAGRSQRRLGV